MLNKKTVKAQCRKQFKEPISSTQYIAFQKSHPEFPSYLRLKSLYGSWDAFCLSTWGKGGEPLGVETPSFYFSTKNDAIIIPSSRLDLLLVNRSI